MKGYLLSLIEIGIDLFTKLQEAAKLTPTNLDDEIIGFFLDGFKKLKKKFSTQE